SPIDHAQAGQPLARGGAPPRQLECDEIEVADEKGNEQGDRDRDQAAASHADRRNERNEDRQYEQKPDDQIDDERDHSFAVVRKLDRQRTAFRCDDLAAFVASAFEEVRGPVVRERRDCHGRRSLPARQKKASHSAPTPNPMAKRNGGLCTSWRKPPSRMAAANSITTAPTPPPAARRPRTARVSRREYRPGNNIFPAITRPPAANRIRAPSSVVP